MKFLCIVFFALFSLVVAEPGVCTCKCDGTEKPFNLVGTNKEACHTECTTEICKTKYGQGCNGFSCKSGVIGPSGTTCKPFGALSAITCFNLPSGANVKYACSSDGQQVTPTFYTAKDCATTSVDATKPPVAVPANKTCYKDGTSGLWLQYAGCGATGLTINACNGECDGSKPITADTTGTTNAPAPVSCQAVQPLTDRMCFQLPSGTNVIYKCLTDAANPATFTGQVTATFYSDTSCQTLSTTAPAKTEAVAGTCYKDGASGLFLKYVKCDATGFTVSGCAGPCPV